MDTTGWKARLEAALKEKDITPRAASLKAGFAPGYAHSLLREGKDPSVTNLLALCDVIGVSGIYVIFGFDVDPETELVMRKMQEKPAIREGILKLLEARDKA